MPARSNPRLSQSPPAELLFVRDLLENVGPLAIHPFTVCFDGQIHSVGSTTDALRVDLVAGPIPPVDDSAAVANRIIVLSDRHQGRLPRIASAARNRCLYWYQWPELLSHLVCDSVDVATERQTAVLLSDTPQLRSSFAAMTDAAGLAGWACKVSDPLPNCRPLLVAVDGWVGGDGAAWLSDAASDRSMLRQMVAPPIIAAVRRARTAYPRVVIVVLEDFPRWETAQRLIRAGANGVCGKPLDLGRLLTFAGRPDVFPLFGGTPT